MNGNYKNEYELIGKNLKLEANNLENNSIIASSGNTEIKGNNSFKIMKTHYYMEENY